MEKERLNSLPENAQRELNPGEEYQPLLEAGKKWAEVTPYSVAIGLLMVIIFSAAAAYLGLRVGQVFEAAIPIAIIAVGLTSALGRRRDWGRTSSSSPSEAAQERSWQVPYSPSLRSTSWESRSTSCRCSSPPCLEASWESCSSFLSGNIS